MSNCADPTRLSPDERFREVATILAAGISRLRQQLRIVRPKKTEKNLAEIAARWP